MKKLIFTMLVCIALVSCERPQKRGIPENNSRKYTCIEGHRYILIKDQPRISYAGYGFMAPLFNKEGKPQKCNN